MYAEFMYCYPLYVKRIRTSSIEKSVFSSKQGENKIQFSLTRFGVEVDDLKTDLCIGFTLRRGCYSITSGDNSRLVCVAFQV